MDTEKTQQFIAKTTVFEGPLDLLLSLIESRKLFINEISLSQIAEEYASHVQQIKENASHTYYELTGYLVILATLLLIKSRSLLPNFDITTEEKVTIEDLEDRLNLYKIYKDIGKILADRFDQSVIHLKPAQKQEIRFIPDSQINLDTVLLSIQQVVDHAPTIVENEPHPEVKVRTAITLEDVMKRIEDKVTNLTSTFSFNEFTGAKKAFTKEEKVFTVISFLAILELIRTGLLSADQDNAFGDMNITRNQIHDTL
jgi:segregation and condensation protein A